MNKQIVCNDFFSLKDELQKSYMEASFEEHSKKCSDILMEEFLADLLGTSQAFASISYFARGFVTLKSLMKKGKKKVEDAVNKTARAAFKNFESEDDNAINTGEIRARFKSDKSSKAKFKQNSDQSEKSKLKKYSAGVKKFAEGIESDLIKVFKNDDVIKMLHTNLFRILMRKGYKSDLLEIFNNNKNIKQIKNILDKKFNYSHLFEIAVSEYVNKYINKIKKEVNDNLKSKKKLNDDDIKYIMSILENRLNKKSIDYEDVIIKNAEKQYYVVLGLMKDHLKKE